MEDGGGGRAGPPPTLGSLADPESQPVHRPRDEYSAQDESRKFELDGSVHDAARLTKSFSTRLLDKVVPPKEEDSHADILRRVHARLANVGMSVPSITVRYDGLTVLAGARVGDATVPTLSRSFHDLAMRLLGRASLSGVKILEGATGVLRPGRLTLLLGPPSSGKSTFMRTVVGQHPYGTRITGDLTFNGETLDRFVPQRAATYIHQHDEHYGELTVRETIDFAARVQSSGYERHMLEDLLARERQLGVEPDPDLDAYMKATAFGRRNNLIVELVLRLIGLDHVAETVVGNAMLRGISGGQKKRLGLGEALVGRSRVLMADEISTGLDSSTTFNISKMLRDSTHILSSTTVVALLQPAPETVALFDDVLLVASGMVLYHGPIDGSLAIFEATGLSCPPRLSPADFLQLVMIPSDQQRFWSRHGQRYEFVTSRAIRDAYEKTEAFIAVREELDDRSWRIEGPVPKTLKRGSERGAVEVVPPTPGSPEATEMSLPRHRYGADVRAMLRANVKRSLKLETGNLAFIIIRVIQVCFIALLVATLALNTPQESIQNGSSLLGAGMFFGLFMQFVLSVPEVQMTAMRLPVLYKQRGARYYPLWTYAFGNVLFRFPFCILDSLLWSLTVYFAVGMQRDATRWLTYYLFIFLMSAWSVTFMWLLGAVFQMESTALACGAFAFLIMLSSGGFVVNKSNIRPWWLGAYWSNPWSYATQALAVNEFRAPHWRVPNPDDPSNPLPLGHQVLHFWTMRWGARWIWIGMGALLISVFINFGMYVVALTFMPPIHEAPTVSQGAIEESDFSRSAEGVVLGPGRKVPEAIASDIATGAVRFARSASSGKDLASKGRSNGDLVALDGPLGAAGDAPLVPEGGGTDSVDGGDSVKATQHSSPATGADAEVSASSTLPFTPLTLTFKDIEYSVPVPKGMDTSKADVPVDGPHAGALRLLKGISGALRPGVLTALMGASGAGKTTLLDVLAGRKTGGTITGDVRVNGFPKVTETFNRVAGYVEQTDIHLPQMTVLESLEFSAALRLPGAVDRATGRLFVREVMGLVELEGLTRAHVGVAGQSGLSIQQRKRLTIAVELVANPSIIFLDEPTTGLDARAASIVMSTVRSVVNTGRTVVCTIHQPSLDIFEEFNELLLLRPGGRVIFAGPVGLESRVLLRHFGSVPGVEPIQAGVNPADWMLDQTNPQNESRLGVDFSEIYASSSLAADVLAGLEVIHEPAPGTADLVYADLAGPRLTRQFLELLKRFFVMYWRAPDYNVSRAFVTIFTAFALGSLCWRQGQHRTQAADILAVAGLLYQAFLFIGWANCTSIMPIANQERQVMYRERAAGAYGAVAFGIAQLAVELPYIVIQAVVYSCIVYWMAAFIADASKFFWFTFYQGLSLMLFSSFGAFCLNLLPDLSLGVLTAAVSFSTFNLFSGFVYPRPQAGWWLRWVYYINPVAWMLNGAISSQLGDLTDETVVSVTGEVVTIPQFLEDLYGYQYSFMPKNVAILIAYIAFFSSISVFALAKINYQNR